MLKRFFAPLGMVLALAAYVLPTTDAKAGDGFAHNLVIHVDENDPAKMNLVLNNASQVTQHYANEGKRVRIEIVAYGPGLTMLRADKSPVAKRMADFPGSFPDISFAACGNTIKKVTKKEGKAPELFDFAKVVPGGVVQIMTRQDQGWHYLRP